MKQTSFEYLKNNLEEFFLDCPDIFISDLKDFFKGVAPEEEENNDYKLLSRQILTPPKKTFSFLRKHGDLFSFWITVLGNKSLANVILRQVRFLEDLMNGFDVYKKFMKSKKKLDYKAKDLYLFLLADQSRAVNNLFLNTTADKHNKEICIQVQILFQGKNF